MENAPKNQLAALAWIIPVGVFLGGLRFLAGRIFIKRGLVSAAWALFFVVIFVGGALSIAPELALAYVTTTVIGVFACAGLWRFLEPEALQSLRLYALGGIGVLAAVAAAAYPNIGRFDMLRNPNSVALILLGLLVSAFAIPEKTLRFGCIGIAMCLVLFTQSRSGFCGAAIALIVMSAFSWKRIQGLKKLFALGTVAPVLVALLFIYSDSISRTAAEILKLHDRYRGIGTGFTGRADVWQETFDLWREHWLFGVGYRLHELHVVKQTSSHNGYLALLAETGILGFVPIMALIVYAGWHLLRSARKGDRCAQIGVALMAAYMFIGFFERMLINFGNPTSVLFLMFLLKPPRELPAAMRARPALAPFPSTPPRYRMRMTARAGR